MGQVQKHENIHDETPMEFFKERVEEAITHQSVESSPDCVYYLTQLLATFVRPDRLFDRAGVDPDQPLAMIFCEALGRGDARRLVLLKLTGDLALFWSGFSPDSLRRQLVGPEYYFELGESAYSTLSAERRAAAGPYAELALKFALFADVLSEVSENCSLCDDSDLLRLYERWQASGSQRSAETLRRHGILVVPSSQEVH